MTDEWKTISKSNNLQHLWNSKQFHYQQQAFCNNLSCHLAFLGLLTKLIYWESDKTSQNALRMWLYDHLDIVELSIRYLFAHNRRKFVDPCNTVLNVHLSQF